MCAVEDDGEELREMCGPQCWHGLDADPGGFKKTLWFEVNDNCKAVSAWSSCDDQRERAFTRKAWETNDRTSHVDCILGPKKYTCATYIHNEVVWYMRSVPCVCHSTRR